MLLPRYRGYQSWMQNLVSVLGEPEVEQERERERERVCSGPRAPPRAAPSRTLREE